MDKPTKKEINDVLNKDSLAETEKLLKKDYDDFSESEQNLSLMKFVLDNKKKEDVLKRAKDTYFSISWKDFIDLIENNGFKLQSKWVYSAFSSPATAVIYKKDGMLLIATSTGRGEKLNSGHLYTELELKDGITWGDIHTFQTGGFFDAKHNKLSSSYDIREGLIHHIQEIEQKTTILPIFESRNTRPWFATFEDEQKYEHDFDKYDEIRTKRIMESTEDIKTLCSPFINLPFILKEGTYSDLDIKHVNLTSNIYSVQSGAFKNCPKLEEINIKSDVYIPVDMVVNCPNLKRLVVCGVEVPLINGQIRNNSLTGIIDGFKKEYDSIENVINEMKSKKNNLNELIDKYKNKNKMNMINVLICMKKEVMVEDSEFLLSIPEPRSSIIKFKADITYSNHESFSSEKKSKDEILDIIDDIINNVRNGTIDSFTIDLPTQKLQHEVMEVNTEQIKLLEQNVDKINKKLVEYGIDINESRNEEIR